MLAGRFPPEGKSDAAPVRHQEKTLTTVDEKSSAGFSPDGSEIVKR
jgi:hypothetical protein